MELIHTCYRVTDPERSIAFYEALGMEKRRELPIATRRSTTSSVCRARRSPSSS